MTAATPMIMPSIVRPVRILLRPSALNAMRNVIAILLAGCHRACPPGPPAAGRSRRRASARRCRRRRFGAGRHIRDERRVRLQIALDQLGRLAVADAEAHPQRLQPVVLVNPDAALGLDDVERAEQRRRSSSALVAWSRHPQHALRCGELPSVPVLLRDSLRPLR